MKYQSSIKLALFDKLYKAYLISVSFIKFDKKDDQSQLEDFLCDAVVDGFKILERKYVE